MTFTNNTKETNVEKNAINTINVVHAINFVDNNKSTVVFTAFINDIMISDLSLIELKNKEKTEFIGFPKRKQNENYFNRVYFKYSQEDLVLIKKAIAIYNKEKPIKVIDKTNSFVNVKGNEEELPFN